MKILITGCNKNQCTENFYLRQQLSVVPSHYSLLRCLRDMGHEVEQRLVRVGEDLSEYDRVVVFLASPRQALQLAFYNGMWAVSQRPDCILAFDDWQIADIQKGISSCKDEASLIKEFTINQNRMTDPEMSDALVRPHVEKFLAAVQLIAARRNRVLISAFAGGDLSLLLDHPADLLYRYNPNPYHRNRVPGNMGDVDVSETSFMEQQTAVSAEEDTIRPESKSRRFNFASLVQGKTTKWLKRQRVGWPVDYFGSRSEGQKRLTEGEMCRVFAEQWGCLMPGYDHSGSGWWRARPLQVADAGSILIGEPKEMMLYYGDRRLSELKASDLTDLSGKELQEIALAQKDAIYRLHPLDKEVQRNELKSALDL